LRSSFRLPSFAKRRFPTITGRQHIGLLAELIRFHLQAFFEGFRLFETSSLRHT
jgi:hypothetical protein